MKKYVKYELNSCKKEETTQQVQSYNLHEEVCKIEIEKM